MIPELDQPSLKEANTDFCIPLADTPNDLHDNLAAALQQSGMIHLAAYKALPIEERQGRIVNQGLATDRSWLGRKTLSNEIVFPYGSLREIRVGRFADRLDLITINSEHRIYTTAAGRGYMGTESETMLLNAHGFYVRREWQPADDCRKQVIAQFDMTRAEMEQWHFRDDQQRLVTSVDMFSHGFKAMTNPQRRAFDSEIMWMRNKL
jgi:hypothetical protein